MKPYILILSFAFASGPVAQCQQESTRASIHGRVMAPDGSALAGARFALEDTRGSRFPIQADESGAYSAELEPGLYRIALEEISRFRPFIRSRFRLQAARDTLINVTPLPPAPIYETLCAAGYNCDMTVQTPAPKYQTFDVMGHDLVIRYSRLRNISARSTTFEDPFAMASYDTFALYASEIEYDGQREVLRAGMSIIDDGKRRWMVQSVIVDLRTRLVTAYQAKRSLELHF